MNNILNSKPSNQSSMNLTHLLEQLVLKSEQKYQKKRGGEEDLFNLNPLIVNDVKILTTFIESRKGVITVVVTLLVYKCFHSYQDIRYHKKSLKNGFSGRSFDTKHITPFLQKNNFIAPKESGWLTRSLETSGPFTKNFIGPIKPNELKKAFLNLLDYIEQYQVSSDEICQILESIFYYYVKYREEKRKDLETSQNQISNGTDKMKISLILNLLTSHFTSTNQYGTARLPVLAIYAIYQCLIKQLKKYQCSTLQILYSHNSADCRNQTLADIVILNNTNCCVEAIEIKFNKKIDDQIIRESFRKILQQKNKQLCIETFFFLSTIELTKEEKDLLAPLINELEDQYKCEIILDNVLNVISNSLRIIEDPKLFLQNYNKLLNNDNSITNKHRKNWQQLLTDTLR